MTATSAAAIATPLAARYLVQLCKHFEHKLTVSYGPDETGKTTGKIAFGSGICHLAAEPESLDLHIEAPDEPTCVQLQGVVARHLERFAFRAPLEITWQPSAT